MSDVLMKTYARLPVAFTHGAGARLWDDQGREYLDALSGIAVCNLGHAHPRVRDTLCAQAERLVHTSNLYRIPAQEALGAKLCRVSGLERVFFCNSGAEANEAAIKLARLHGHQRGLSRPTIAVMSGAFHGRTLAALAATGNEKARRGFEPTVEGFVRLPFGDLAAAEALAHTDTPVAAILVEPIQGEGGIRVPPAEYLPGLRALCDRQGWLLMVDEVQAGMARTGRWFGHQHSGIRPDVMTLAKALGNGVPIGACVAGGVAAELFAPGHHGSTFGGNPLASAVGCAVLETIDECALGQRAATLGTRMLGGFREGLGRRPEVREVRGQGLMLGIELDRPCGALVGQALEAGLLINVTAESTIRLLPPLVIDDAQADRIVAEVTRLVEQFLDG